MNRLDQSWWLDTALNKNLTLFTFEWQLRNNTVLNIVISMPALSNVV